MREILYRGKRKDNDKWVYGYYCRCGWTGMEKDVIIPSYASALYGIDVIPETIGQYTGLTDKNGKKIFEGDIVKYYGICKTIIGVVKICKEDFSGLYGVCGAFTDGSGTTLLRSKIDYQVVGNIYDTPEMLKQRNDDCIYADFNKKAEV